VIGILNLQSVNPSSYTEIDLRLAEKIGAQIAGAIANAQLYNERKRAEEAVRKSEEKTKRLAQENAGVAEIGRIISSTLNIEEVYERFSEEVKKLIPVDRTAFTIINPKDRTATTAYGSGVEIPTRLPGEAFALAGSATEMAEQVKTGLIIPTENENEVAARVPGLLPVFRAGIRSVMMIPLISRDEVIGVLNLQSTKPKAYTEKELRIAERVGSQIAGAIANTQLFSEHKRAEEALQESEMRFRDLYDNAPLGYHEYDHEGRITNVNRRDLEMLGYTAEEMIGQFMWKFNVEEEIAQQQILEKLAGTRPPGRNLERTYRRKDGTTFPVLIEDRLILDGKGGIKGIRCTIQDITDRKRAEKEMADLQEQLHQSQKMEAIGCLAGGISHDFNNLLSIIIPYCQMALLDLKEIDPLRDTVEKIHKAGQRAADLTRQLLAFSRRQMMEMKVLDLNALLTDLNKMLHRLIGEDIELVYEFAEDLGRVKADAGQIEQIVLNLAVNARDAMPEGGKLTIETANVELDEKYAKDHFDVNPGPFVMLMVSDTGAGMTAEIREKIFEPFFTTKEKGKGTGLGLAVVYGIVKQSGGFIHVYSEPGMGTTFRIYFPRVDDRLEESKVESRKELLRGGETVLVVEDEGEVRKLAVTILRKQGYKVLEAGSGGEAILFGEGHENPIHLMVTDVVLPGMGGRVLAERLSPLHPEMKVLYMSGYTYNSIGHHGILEEGVHFIQKPFTLEGFTRKIREVLDQSERGVFS
jgi:PAS domain S-box-containing protein